MRGRPVRPNLPCDVPVVSISLCLGHVCAKLTLILALLSVTAVGSTQGVSPEVAAPFSSGGFSNIFPRPAYQFAAATNYLNMLNASATNATTSSPDAANPLAGKFNSTGRAFPDVATQGRDIVVVVAGQPQPILGTSASSPTFASIVALINDRLSVQGKPPMGFLNPWLYSTGKSALTDITAGNNSIECNGETAGFEAIEGWDPVRICAFSYLLGSLCSYWPRQVTGLGTPDFNKLLNAVGL